MARPEQTTLFYRGGQYQLRRGWSLRDLIPPFTRRTMRDRLFWFKRACRIITECPEVLEDQSQLDPSDVHAQIVEGWTPHVVFRNRVDRTEARKRLGVPLSEALILLPFMVSSDKGAGDLLAVVPELATLGARVVLAGRIQPELVEELDRKSDIRAAVHVDDRFVPESEMDLYFSAADAVVQMHHYGSGTFAAAVDYQVPLICQAEGKAAREVLEYGLGEIAGKPGDRSALVEAIGRCLLWDQARRDSFIQGCARYRSERTPGSWLDAACGLAIAKAGAP